MKLVKDSDCELSLQDIICSPLLEIIAYTLTSHIMTSGCACLVLVNNLSRFGLMLITMTCCVTGLMFVVLQYNALWTCSWLTIRDAGNTELLLAKICWCVAGLRLVKIKKMRIILMSQAVPCLMADQSYFQ